MKVSDLDILLFLLCFSSYITIRFVIESGFILGSFLFILIFVAFKKTSGIRQNLYLYFILLFTTKEEQEWLQRKFDFSLNSCKSDIRNEVFSNEAATDVVNKTLSEFWPFISCFVEEQVRSKIEKLVSRSNDSKIKPLLHYLVEFRTEEISLGSNPPKLRTVKCHLSKDMKNLIYDLHFEFSGNGCLKYSTRMKKINLENIKVKGRIRIEIGPFQVKPPFFHGVKIFMPEVPSLHYSLSNTPEKVVSLAQLLILEKISSALVIPNCLYFVLSKDEQLVNFMPSGVIYINVVEARNLSNKEAIGTSDPYCVLLLGHQKAVSNTVKHNLNPIWNFATQMICYSDPSSGGLDLSVVVQDEDLGHEAFHDCLLRCKLNVRRVFEETFVDEWLEEDPTVGGDLGQQNRGKIRVQAVWQKLSVDKTILMESCDTEDSEDGTENITTKNILNSNPEEINSSESIESLGSSDADEYVMQKKKNKKIPKTNFFKTVLIVWVDSARNLQPSWEDFQFEMEVSEKVERTSFVARDKRHRWSWRRRFVFPVIGQLKQDLQIKLFSGTRGKCYAYFSLSILKLMKSSELELNLKDTPIHCKNPQEKEASLNLSVALRVLEPLSNEASKRVNEAQNEQRKAAVPHYWRETSSQISSSLSRENQQGGSFMEKNDFFYNSDMGWDSLPSFLIPHPYFDGTRQIRRGSSKKKRITEEAKNR